MESSTLSFARKTKKKTSASEGASDKEQQDKIQGGFIETDSLAQSRKKGGQACLKTYGVDHYREMGQKGGLQTKQRHDAEYYRRIGAMGREARRKKKQERHQPSVSSTNAARNEKERGDAHE